MPNTTIKLKNEDVEIELPLTAVDSFEDLVALAHLVVLGAPVMKRQEAEPLGSNAGQDVLKAMASKNPVEALQALRDKFRTKESGDGLTAEKLEKGEDPTKDRGLRTWEIASKCAANLDIPHDQSMPLGTLIKTIAGVAVAARNNADSLCATAAHGLEILKMSASEEKGVAGAAKNIVLLGKIVAEATSEFASADRGLDSLMEAMAVGGMQTQQRPNAKPHQIIEDCTNAIRLATRRGHQLGKPAKASEG